MPDAVLPIVPMQIRVIKHIRKVCACRGCETAPVTADKSVQLIEKRMTSPSVLAMSLTTKYVDGLPLHRSKKYSVATASIFQDKPWHVGSSSAANPATAAQLDA